MGNETSGSGTAGGALALTGAARRWVNTGLALGGLGLVAWLARWLMQGESVMWTDIARPFWVQKGLLGWVETDERWVWLGLEGLGVVAGVVLGTLALVVLIPRLARAPRIARALRMLAPVGAGVAMLAPVMPAWAFVSGFPPEGARRLLPDAAVVVPATGGDDGAAMAPAIGRWRIDGGAAGTLVVARIAAGQEEFDARFKPAEGELVIVSPVAGSTARVSVPAASISTGVDLRDSHARDYLMADKFGAIALTIPKVDQVVFTGASCTYAAKARVTLMGRELEVPVSGTLTLLDAAQRQEVGVAAGVDKALLATATFTISVAATPLDKSNFDKDAIAITGRFVLVPGTSP